MSKLVAALFHSLSDCLKIISWCAMTHIFSDCPWKAVFRSILALWATVHLLFDGDLIVQERGEKRVE